MPNFLIALSILSIDTIGQDRKVFNGIVTDGHRWSNRFVSAIIKGTTAGTVTDLCGRFSIPVETGDFAILFHGMSYDDMRTYEVKLKKSELSKDTIVFQLGHLKVKNPNCNRVDKKFKKYVM